MEDKSHWQNEHLLTETTYGFVYTITNRENNRCYIGQKRLVRRLSKPPLKGKTRRRVSITESDWRTYTGSSKELNADIARLGIENFDFVIINTAQSKWELNYLEAYHILTTHAIPRNDFYNEYLGRIGRCPEKCKY